MRTHAVGLAVLAGLLCGASPQDAAVPSSDVVVHEWGTFLGMSGSDGVALDGMYHEEHALPGFVHARSRDQLRWRSIFSKGETPVIYFYTKKAQNASVEVKFPRGLWTQWYPQAAFVLPRFAALPVPATDPPRDGRIVWNVEILPANAGEAPPVLPPTSTDSLWNFAREVDAAFVRTHDPVKSRFVDDTALFQIYNQAKPGTVHENEEFSLYNQAKPVTVYDTERFLFYRGLGTAPLPVRMTTEGGGTVTADAAGPGVAHLFVLRVEGGKGAFTYYPALTPGQTLRQTIPSLSAALPAKPFADNVADALAARLVESGLYAKEARAMVNTWRSSYFGTDGVRLLFILPQTWTDAAIPLRIRPTPKAVTRVMVGRLELLTPEREQLAENAVKGLGAPDPAERFRAFKVLEAQGRYVEPIVRRVLASSRDEEVCTLCRRLLLADYVTDLRAVVRSPVATKPVPSGMVANEEAAYIRARLAGLLRDVGFKEEAKVEGRAALAALRTHPKPSSEACDNRHDMRALALALEATGDDEGAARRYGELVDLGGLATRRQDCRKCHQQSGAVIAGGLRDWWAGAAFAQAVQRSGRLEPTIAIGEGENDEQHKTARLRLAYLYSLAGRKAQAEKLWTQLGEPRAPLAARN